MRLRPEQIQLKVERFLSCAHIGCEIFSQSQSRNLPFSKKILPSAFFTAKENSHWFAPFTRTDLPVWNVNIHSSSLHFRFSFLFTICALDSEDFIDSFADFGIVDVYLNIFRENVSLRFYLSNFISSVGKKRSIFCRFFFHCVMSRAFHPKNFFLLFAFLCNSKKHIFSLVYTRSANVQCSYVIGIYRFALFSTEFHRFCVSVLWKI